MGTSANLAPIAIPRSTILALGKDPSTVAKFPPNFGLGDEAYIGRFDVFHQLHCLDTIRKEMFAEYYYPSTPDSTDAKKAELHRTHVSHCLYILLQKVTCDADLDIITHYWTDMPSFAAYLDFDLQKLCRGIDDLFARQVKNGISLEEFGKLKRPNDADVTVMSDEFKRLWDY